MKKDETPLLSDIVFVGGGHAHVHALKMFGMEPIKSIIKENGIQVTLISSSVITPYSGMLPGLVAGHYTSEEIHLDLRKICSFSNIRFIHAAATGITYDDKSGIGGGWVKCSDGRPDVRYDTISIDIGSCPSIPDSLLSLQGSEENTGVTPVKPIATFAQRWNEICQRLHNAHIDLYSPDSPYVLLVVGAGAGGIELALSAQFTLENILRSKGMSIQDSINTVKIILATRGMELLPTHNESVRRIFGRILEERNIEVRYGAEAAGVEETYLENSSNKSWASDASRASESFGSVMLRNKQVLKLTEGSNNQDAIEFDDCLWCTSAGASSWLQTDTPFETTIDGFLKVNDTYESVSHKGVFAAGDCCHMVDNPRPKAGVFAVRAGPTVKDNLVLYLLKETLVSHKPQEEFLGLISTGDKYAVASRGEHALEGEFLWRLKDEIDRGWMGMYQNLPTMEEMEDKDKAFIDNETQFIASTKAKFLSAIILATRGADTLAAFNEAPMRCGGCGAKVGSRTLTRVLDIVFKRRLKKHDSNLDPEGNVEPNKIDPDDAAIVMLPERGGGAIVQTIDFFRSFISDPFTFGKIAAVHALSDCHAMGAKAQTALALAVVKFAANEAMTERALVDMLSGASDILYEDGCDLAGGHTCEGAEQALGFSVTGYVEDPSKLLRKRGGKVGDKIILTKAIGTGALFAADMRAKCRGEFVEEAILSMTTSNGPASRIAMSMIEHGYDGIHSCTDVTGFGLCGHLLEMLLANDECEENLDSISASIDLSSIPFLAGAKDAIEQGINSSLYRENSRSRRAVINHEEAVKQNSLYPLIFDPQTAGGLLFFVSPAVCPSFVKKLSEDCHTQYASVIGELTLYEAQASQTATCDIDGKCISTEGRILIENL